MSRDPDTIVTAPPTTLMAAHRPPERRDGHRVLWFALGCLLWILNAGLASIFLGLSRAIWHW